MSVKCCRRWLLKRYVGWVYASGAPDKPEHSSEGKRTENISNIICMTVWSDLCGHRWIDGSLNLLKEIRFSSLSFQSLEWNEYLGACCVPPSVCDRPFITELSVSIKLSPLLWWQHYSSGSGGTKQAPPRTSPASYRSLYPPLPTARLSAWHRRSMHVDDASRLLLLGRRYHGVESGTGRKEGAERR